MKRKDADRSTWSRITKRRFGMIYLDESNFRGYVTLLCIDEVKAPLVMEFGDESVCIADKGYQWLQHFPQGENYTITTNFNAEGDIVRWYVDICKPYFLESDMLYYDDLYLDLDISPEGKVGVLDSDELDDALRQKEVTLTEYDLTWRVASSLMDAIEEDQLSLLWLGDAHREMLLRML